MRKVAFSTFWTVALPDLAVGMYRFLLKPNQYDSSNNPEYTIEYIAAKCGYKSESCNCRGTDLSHEYRPVYMLVPKQS